MVSTSETLCVSICLDGNLRVSVDLARRFAGRMLHPDATRAKSLQLHLELSPFSLWHRHEQGKPREASVRQRTRSERRLSTSKHSLRH